MSGFKLAFQPMTGQWEALGAAGSGAAQLARELRDLAGALGRCGGMEAFSTALAALGEGVETCGGRIAALGSRLEEIHSLYLQAEQRIADEIEGSPPQAVSGQGSPGPAEQAGQGESSPYGGTTGPLETAWNWIQEDHSLWEAGVSGSALGGAAVGSAGISALFYSSDFSMGDEYSQDTSQSLDGSNKKTEEGVSLGVGAGGSAGLLHAGAEGRIGGDYAGLYGEISGDVGVVTVGGTVGVFADDDSFFAGAKGEAGVYAAQGEVTGGLDLGFMKIGGSLEGSVGAGVSGEVGFDDGKFKIGASAALGLGGGFSLDLDFSPAIDWFKDFF